MNGQNVYMDIAARCGGSAKIGVAGEEGAAAKFNAALAEATGGEGCHVTFCDGLDGCAAAIAVGEVNAAAVERRGLPFVVAEEGEVAPSSLERLMRSLILAFPLSSVDVIIPSWVRSLPADNSAVSELMARVRACAARVNTMADCSVFDDMMADSVNWQEEVECDVFPDSGRVVVRAKIKDGAFFNMLSETAGEPISDESSLMSFVVSAAEARKNYGKVKDALECARVTGYGIVQPSDDDLSLEKPSVVRQGSNVGVKLKASAPSYHIIKIDVNGEVSPIMGGAAQSEGMVNDIMNGFENDPQSMWNTNLFGKSLRAMVQEGLAGKVNCMQDDTRAKMRKAITRMVNEGKGGVICILL